MNWRDLQLRMRAILFRRRVEQELDEELHLHLAIETRQNIERGMSEGEANRAKCRKGSSRVRYPKPGENTQNATTYSAGECRWTSYSTLRASW